MGESRRKSAPIPNIIRGLRLIQGVRNGMFRVRGRPMISITTKPGAAMPGMTCGWMAHARRMALCSALGLLVLATVAPGRARAKDDDGGGQKKPTIGNFEQKFPNGGMRPRALKTGSESSIEYRGRPPLVTPPSRNLPPPAQAGAGQTA